MELAIVGPIKVKDGIFMGDEYAAHVTFLKLFNIFCLKKGS